MLWDRGKQLDFGDDVCKDRVQIGIWMLCSTL